MTTFASKLRRRLDQLGINQREFAKRAQLSEGRVSHYLKGKHVPDRRAVMERIAAALEVNIQWFDQ